MRKGRPKYPQPREVGPVLKALQFHFPESEISWETRESIKHVPCRRISGVTNEKKWIVDVYRGGFMYAQVESTSESFTSLFLLLNFLKRWLLNN